MGYRCRFNPRSTGWFCLAVWVGLRTACSLCGWTLAWLGYLGPSGYAVLFALGLAGIGLAVVRFGNPPLSVRWPRLRRRFLPMGYAVVFATSLLGGICHAPNNYDALTYRLPQILHWLSAERWHWITTWEMTMNITAPGYGWMMAPLIALTGSDRALFLPSLLSFAALPGAFFVCARGFGVPGRVAWTWMWLMPLASCFALQSGGLGNDIVAATDVLIAGAFGFRAARSRATMDLVLAVWAAALATGIKVTVLPLLLPLLVIFVPAARATWTTHWRPLATFAATLVAIVISFIPTAALNWAYTGHWSGDPTDYLKVRSQSVAHTLLGNVCEIVAGAVAPPILPTAAMVNQLFEQWSIEGWLAPIRANYPRFWINWTDLSSEETAGLGVAWTLIATFSLITARRFTKEVTPTQRWIRCAVLGCSLVFLGVSATEAMPRVASPYYPFIILLLLQRVQPGPAWSSWLSTTGYGVLLASTLLVILLTPARPLWPVNTVIRLLERRGSSELTERLGRVYNTYGSRARLYAELRKGLPADVRVVGFIPTDNDIESPLWWPVGGVRVEQVVPPPMGPKGQRAPRWIVAMERGLRDRLGLTETEFVRCTGARVVLRVSVSQKARVGPETCFLFELPGDNVSPQKSQ